MFSLLLDSCHLSPTNSLSDSRYSILLDSKIQTKRSIKSILSYIQELPNFDIKKERTGKVTPLYTIPRVRMFVFFVPNFLFVLSRTTLYGGSGGRSTNINFATRSESSEYYATNLYILRKKDPVLTLDSKPQANFSKQTVCSLHNALINKTKNLIRTKFILLLKNSFNVSDNTATLFSTLASIFRNSIGNTILIYIISMFYGMKLNHIY